jgi:hypothetical protein
MTKVEMKEMVEMCAAEYRRGYLDGMNDRKDAPQPSISAPMPQMDEQMQKMALELQNLMGYDGSPQPTIEETYRRTRE